MGVRIRLIPRLRSAAEGLLLLALSGLVAHVLACRKRESTGNAGSAKREWTWVSPKPQGRSLFAVAGDAQEVCAVGAVGAVVCSVDGGETWRVLTSLPGELSGVAVRRGVFVAVGNGGVFRGAAGSTLPWSRVKEAGRNRWRAVAPLGDGFVVAGDSGSIAVSRDLGLTWRAVASGSERDLTEVATDGDYVIAAGQAGALVESIDAGKAWSSVSAPVSDVSAIAARQKRVYLVNASGSVFVGSQSHRRWDEVDSRIGDPRRAAGYGDGIVVIGEKRLSIVAPGAGGTGWVSEMRTLEQLSESDELNGFAGIESGKAFVVGTGGLVLGSADFARTWRAITASIANARTMYEDVWSDSEGNVLAVGRNGIVLKGNAPRNQWSATQLMYDGRIPVDLTAVWSDGMGTALVAGSSREMFRSHDSGETWQQLEDTPLSVGAIAGSGAEIVAAGDGLLLTEDGGRQWTEVTPAGLGASRGFCSIWLERSGKYVAVGPDGLVVESGGKGRGWRTIKTAVEKQLNVVRGGRGGDVWAAGESGTLLRRRSGVWSRLTCPVESTITCISISSDGEILLGTDHGEVWNSLDAGRTWRQDGVPTGHWLAGFVVSRRHIWSIGDYGSILERL